MDLQSLLQGGMMNLPQPGQDVPTVDTGEQVLISPLALLKMLKHGRAGVPMEVMGLMLGDFVDDYTVRVVDVFAMPQSGTGVSVEAVDPVFQTKMLDMLKQTGRPEMVVGWYHSHPGFGPWLSSVDVNTQMSFEQLNKRAVAVVIDPIQSVKGKVVIDAFRCIPSQMIMAQREPRQTTSQVGLLHKPSIVALIHGLNRHYYSLAMTYRCPMSEQRALKCIEKRVGVPVGRSDLNALLPLDPAAYNKRCLQVAQDVSKWSALLAKKLKEDLAANRKNSDKDEEKDGNDDAKSKDKASATNDAKKRVGKRDPRRHLDDSCELLTSLSMLQTLSATLVSSIC